MTHPSMVGLSFLVALVSLLPLLTVGAAAAKCASLPQNITLHSNPILPNPFALLSSGLSVKNVEEWACRRKEIGELFQRFELGTLPPRPEGVSSLFTSTAQTLLLSITNNGKHISFTVRIQTPSTGSGPFPAIIAFGGTTIPFPEGVALITFNNTEIAQQTDQSSRGQGKFYDLYGHDHPAGALIAWSWAVSRIIDGLEMTVGHGVDPKRVGVTGCSRNGKGAFVAGAFEERIALTIVQESGSGGAGCWRISDEMLKEGIVTQTASEIVQENVWFSPNFDAYVDDVSVLPFDHHMLAGLVAPRGLLVIDNTGIDWLGPESVWGCQTTGRKIYEALGVPDAMGITQQGNHSHCALPAEEAPDVAAFVDKFLLRNLGADTDIVNTDGPNNVGFVEAQWVDWSVPNLVPRSRFPQN